MQQRQRLKNLEKFKRGVNEIEAGVDTSAILVCTDVAARGLDIPYVSNVLHYQCPWNAELYVHRCGRTARIGRDGECLALLSPEDNKAFKGICQVLKKTEDDLQQFEVKYSVLEKIKPLIDQAKTIEKTVHRTNQDEKAANWMIQAAQDADLTLDEAMQHEIAEKLGSKAKKRLTEDLADSRVKEFEYDNSI